jgi:hypothetical protein
MSGHRLIFTKYDWFMFRSAKFHTGKAASTRFNWELAAETARGLLWKMASDAMAEHEELFPR